MSRNKSYSQVFAVIIILIVVNFAGTFAYKRFDLTHDKRYTLSEETIRLVEQIEKPVIYQGVPPRIISCRVQETSG